MLNNKPIIKISMLKSVLIALFVYTVCSSVFITPAYPPTAFQNQYYTLKFRIRGLDFPVYKISGLPDGLQATSDGTISGIPTIVGSFSIKLIYTAGDDSGSKQFILKVLEDSLTLKNDSVSATQTSKGIIISFPDNLIFRVGQKITLKLKAEQGSQPYVWAFLNLPQGLVSDSKTGQLQGYLQQAGYYNLNIQVADKDGKSASAFLTINAQPSASLKSQQVIQVEVQNTKSQTNLASIENQQVQADKALFDALDLVDHQKKIVDQKKQLLAVQTLKQQNANNSQIAAQQIYNDAAQNKSTAQQLLTNTLNALNSAQKNLDLALTEKTSSSRVINESRTDVDTANKRFNDAQKLVDNTQSAYVDAKDKYSKAESNLRDANTSKNTAQEQYKRAARALQDAKTQLQDARKRKNSADLAVKQAQDALELATQSRDDADNQLSKSDYSLKDAEKKLDAALAKVSNIRQKYNAAKDEYKAQQLEYNLNINKLYVAQARKQTADRATAIALAQGSLSDHNTDNNGVNVVGSSNSNASLSSNVSISTSSSTLNSASFVGCDSFNYPSIVGTAQINSVSSNGYTLSSGHQIIYGSCSKVQQAKVGDFVSYNGVLVNSVVNAARIQRVLLS